MRPNPKENADLVRFNEETLNEKLNLCTVFIIIFLMPEIPSIPEIPI